VEKALKMIPHSMQDIFRNCIFIVVDNAAGHSNCLRQLVESKPGQRGSSSHQLLKQQNTTTTSTALSTPKIKSVKTNLTPIALRKSFSTVFGTTTRTMDFAPRIPRRSVDVAATVVLIKNNNKRDLVCSIDKEDKVLQYRTTVITTMRRQSNVTCWH
jgi:hypothetical protein